MYRRFWHLKKRALTPSVLANVRAATFAILLLGTAVRAVFLALPPSTGLVVTIVFIAIVAGVVVLASAIEFVTRRSGARPELRDVYEIRQAVHRLDRFRDDARAARTRDDMKRLFGDFVQETLALACKALRHSRHIRISVMLPSDDSTEDCLRIRYVYPSAPISSVGAHESLPLHSDKDHPLPGSDIGAAGFAFRGVLFSVYVPWTKNRLGYWTLPVTNGELEYEEIGAIWVPDPPPERLKSLLAVPIVVEGRGDTLYPWGVVNYGSTRRDALGGADIYVCLVFANVLAQAFSITASASGRLEAS